MKYPKLVLPQYCRTPIKVTIYEEGLSEDGGPKIAFEADDLKCNYQDTAKTIFTDDGKKIQLSGQAIFCVDFCPGIETITGGVARIHGEDRKIHKGLKARNPDGSVNYVRLGLM